MGLGQAVGARNQHQRALPEFLFLVVLGQTLAQIAGLADVGLGFRAVLALAEQHIDRHLIALRHLQKDVEQGARHLDHLHDACRDFRNPYAARVAAGQEDLYGLRSRCRCIHGGHGLFPSCIGSR